MKDEHRRVFASLTDIHILGLLIYGEARGENLLGKIAVGFVVCNRMKDKRWPDSLAEVILQPKQFSCLNENDPNFYPLLERAQQGRFFDRNPVWRECQYAAYGVLCNWIIDPTKGANHYHTRQVAPSWDNNMQLTVSIDNHNFYRG